MFESRNICDLGLLQNARTHGPRGTVKPLKNMFYIGPKSTIYFCSGNSNQDPFEPFHSRDRGSQVQRTISLAPFRAGVSLSNISAAPCLALARRRLGSPQVCSISQGHLPGYYVCRLMPFLLSTSVTKPSRAAWSTPQQPIASALPGRNTAVRRSFKTCAKHVPPGPETLPCSFSLCQRFARSYLAFRWFHPRTRDPPVHLSPFAFVLPSQNIAFRGFQNLREARSTRARNPSVQLSLPAVYQVGSNIVFREFFALCLCLARSKFCIN